MKKTVFSKRLPRLLLTAGIVTVLLSATSVLAAGGTLDPTFGSNGFVTTQYNNLSSSALEVVLQADGKIVILGSVQVSEGQPAAKIITRYNANGTSDNSFGINGSVPIEVELFTASKIALQPDGKLIVGGTNWQGYFAVVRYNSNGTLDAAFGVNGLGVYEWSYDEFHQFLADMTVQADGKIVLVGDYTVGQANYTDFTFVRFNSNGTKDIGNNMISFVNNRFNYGKAVVIQPDGKIVISGNMQDDDGRNQLSLARLNPDGSLDQSTFGNGSGTVTTRLDFENGSGALALQTDGKIIVAGTNGFDNEDLALVRYTANGVLDTTFGGTGIVTTDFGTDESLDDFVIQPDGKILVEGKISNLENADFLLVRYNNDGSLDTSFGSNGKVTTDFGNTADFARGISLQADGKTIVIGSNGTDGILARYETGLSMAPTTTLAFDSTSAHDGWILESWDNSNKGGNFDKRSNIINVGDDGKDRQYRGILSFDTSSIPDNAVVTSAQVKVKRQSFVGANPLKTHGALLLEIRNGTFNNDISLTAADFSAPADSSSPQDIFSGADANWAHSAVLSNANLGLINKYGVTQFRLRFSLDDNDDRGADYIKLFSGDAANGKPQLMVTYSIVGPEPANQPPVITSNGGGATADISLPENSTAVTTITATDPDGQPPIFSISGGADAALFGVDPSADTLFFVTAPSYNAPNDAGLDHVYNVTVQASDGALTDSQELVISILPPNPQPVSLLDSSFGSNGVTATKFNGLTSSTRDIVLQADGKIVVLGDAQSTQIVARYNDNGTLDTSFGSNGNAPISFPSFSGKALVLQPDGKIVVGGWYGGYDGNFAIIRYNNNGAPDTSFGTNGMGRLDWEEAHGSLTDLTIQPDGKIVAVGDFSSGQSNHIDFLLARFNSDGTQDATNTIGWWDFPASRYNWGKAVILQPDNKIVMSGDMIIEDVDKNDISLARINPDFSLDKAAFGINGKGTVITRLDYFKQSRGALAIQPDGKIVVAGTIFNSQMDVPQNLALARFNSNGTLDAGFGGTGIVVTDFGAEESAAGLVIQASGKIIVAGTTSSAGASDFLLVRYNSDGSLDTSFGTDGKLVTDLGNTNDAATGIVQQHDGKFIVNGNSGENAILARYNTGTTSSAPTTSLNFNSVGAYDGWILESGEFSNAGGSLDKISNVFFVGDDAKDRQYRAILSFNTDTIPENATITSAQLKIRKQGVTGSDPFSTHENLLLEIRNGTFSNGIALSLGDFSATADNNFPPDKFTAADGGWYTANLSNANLGLINKYGVTQFRLLFSKDDNDDMGADYARFFSGNAASDLPQLVIAYSTGSGTNNQAPVIYGGASLSINIPENTTSVTLIAAVDPDGQPLAYSLSGLDASKFSINPGTGNLSFVTAPDFEAIPSGTVYHATVHVSDGSLSATQEVYVTVTPVNEFTPVAMSNAGTNISLPENTIDVATITATDADLPAQHIQLVPGGVDGQLFNFDSATGKLSFVTPPIYNSPNDTGADHVYNVSIEANDEEFVSTLELVISIINPTPMAGFTALHQFSGQAGNGRIPYGSLVPYNGVFYGTTTYGGPPYNVPPTNPANKGNIFRVNMDGSGFTILHEFAGGANDGWKPWSGLAMLGNTIYGSTVYGGPRGEGGGVIYEMNLDGSGFRILHAFGEPGDGFGGSSSPILVGDILYGLTRWGGNGTGTVYSYNTTTEVYTQLYRFAANSNDGNAPLGTLTVANDGYLYGLTWLGGNNNLGTLFRIKPDGSAFETLHHFAGGTQGKYPYGTLVFDGNYTLYGTTMGEQGTSLADLGTVFKYNITNKAYSVLHKFTGGANESGKPNGSVALSSDGVTLYGTTHGDDAWGGSEYGILYRMNIDGTGFTQLHEFNGGAAGANPMQTPLLIDGRLYGMTAYGGTENYGLIYRYQLEEIAAAQRSIVPLTTMVNTSPTITSSNAVSVAENNLAVTSVMATDADIPTQSLTYAISGGADAGLLSINPSTGELVFAAKPDYEAPIDAGADNIYNLTVQVSDGAGTVAQELTVTISSDNDNSPAITSGNTFSVSENITAVTTVNTVDADIPSQPLTYSIIGGADATRFAINPSTGELTFVTTPDFDLPVDAGADNAYNVTVQASDGELVGTQDVAVTIIPINDNTPSVTSVANPSVAENNAVVTTVTATDADLPPQPLTYSIAGGADSTLFTVNPSTGELAFVTAPDYEMPKDAGTDNVYNVTVQASDGTLTNTQNVTVTVTPVNDNMPVITSPANFSIPENTTAVTTVIGTDADLPAQSLTYSIVNGADAALFAINPATGALDFVATRDFETPNDAGSDNVYNLMFQVSDGAFTLTKELAVTVLPIEDNAPVVTSPDKFSIPENTTTIAALTATDADRPDQPLTYSIIGGTDATKFSIISATSELTFVAAPDFESPTDFNLDNIYEIIIQVSDGTSSVTKSIAVQVMLRAG